MLSLILRQGGEPKTLHLEEDVITIGRSSKNVVALNKDIKVSRHHAKIEKVGASYRITDLESGNGTCVNGAKTVLETLKRGDMIKIGSATLEVIAIDAEAEIGDEKELDLLPEPGPPPPKGA